MITLGLVHIINIVVSTYEIHCMLVACYGLVHDDCTKEDIGIEQQLYEIVRGKKFVLNCLSWKFIEMIMIINEVIPENFVVVR